MGLPTVGELERLDWEDWPARHVFFTGKGGVGKTTIASGVAVALASAGLRTLLISTDPASNLDDVFGLTAGSEPTPVPAVPNLHVANIDPERAAGAYRERALAPYRGVLPESALASMEEQLAGACTVEIAAFNEFTTILTSDTASGYERVLFDIAPTGHTLRLLTLPSAWSGFAQANPAGASCLGPLAGLDRQQRLYQVPNAVRHLAHRLRDPEYARVIIVTHAETTPIHEAERLQADLARAGIEPHGWLVNASLAETATKNPTLRARAGTEQLHLKRIDQLSGARTWAVAWQQQPPTGMTALRNLAGAAPAAR